MGRLKGLDEMPERTGLEIDWTSMPGSISGGETGSPLASARMKIASIVLALIITGLGVCVIGMGMVPTRAQIQSEANRREMVLRNARSQGDTLEPAIRPGIDGVQAIDGIDGIDGTGVEDRGIGGNDLGRPGGAFPGGTIEWGEEGRPIGGDLERIEIWDVTGSPQDKVIRVRSGPDTIFATMYLGAGQRTRIMVPVGRAYQVTATSGEIWHGTVERFGSTATTVNFGLVTIYEGRPGIIAIGASDQAANVVRNERF